jgi:peptidoglycan-associated lipoprotein
MRIGSQSAFALLLAAALVSTCLSARAQDAGSSGTSSRPELALDYRYLHSNAPPGGCGCFNMNGGSATFAWPLGNGRFALAGDVTVAQSGAITNTGYGLTLSTFTAGVRYSPRVGHTPLKPFAEVLVGAAHATGSLVQSQNSAASNAGAAFAANAGGGLDLHLSRHFALRLIQAGYLVTTFDNGVNDHQNNLRLGAGVVIRF